VKLLAITTACSQLVVELSSTNSYREIGVTARDKTSPLTRSPVGVGALICGGLKCAFEECSWRVCLL